MSHVDDGQLNALLDGELADAEARAVETHLAACAGCKRRYEEARQFLAEAAELLGVLESPAAQPAAGPVAGSAPAAGPVPPADAGEPVRRVSKTAKEIALDIDAATQKSPAIRPVFPREAERVATAPEGTRGRVIRRRPLDVTQLAWAASIVLALGVGYLANEVRDARQPAGLADSRQRADLPRATAPESVGPAPAEEARPRPLAARAGRSQATPVAIKPPTAMGTKPLPPERAADAAVAGARTPLEVAGALGASRPAAAGGTGAGAPTVRAHAEAQDLAAAPPAAAGPQRTLRAAASQPAAPQPAQPRADGGRGAPQRPAPPRAQPSPEERAAEPLAAFRGATTDEAVRRLGGSIRLLDGMFSDHVEVGPGHLVPGADPGRDLVRVVYTDPLSGRLTLDEQRLFVLRDTSAAARLTYLMNTVGMAQGDTLVTVSPNGTTRIRWLDHKNFWISLTGTLPADSLRAMLDRIR